MNDNPIIPEKINALEEDMQSLLLALRMAGELDPTTFDFIQHIRRIDGMCNDLHTTLAGWQLLFSAIRGKMR